MTTNIVRRREGFFAPLFHEDSRADAICGSGARWMIDAARVETGVSIFPKKIWQATKVACPVDQAAIGRHSFASPSLASVPSPSVPAASSCRTLAGAFTLPMPPREV